MRVTASVLNVRSGPGTSFMVIAQRKQGDEVTALETSGEWTRIEPCGWVSTMYLMATATQRAPDGLAAIISRFGPAGSPAASAGRVTLPAPVRVGWQSALVTKIACHIEMEAIFAGVFGTIYERGLWSLIRTYDGIYNDRSIAGSGKKSTHAWGIAIDLNAKTNRTNPGDMDPRLIAAFEQYGFTHGRAFGDPMHFQYASGY